VKLCSLRIRVVGSSEEQPNDPQMSQIYAD
jgi:hypothetical protein